MRPILRWLGLPAAAGEPSGAQSILIDITTRAPAGEAELLGRDCGSIAVIADHAGCLPMVERWAQAGKKVT